MPAHIEAAVHCTPNMTNEIRAYVRLITRRLIELGALRGVSTLSQTPHQYWKFFSRARSSNQWEFLADKKTAVDFCKDYFVPELVDVKKLKPEIDVEELCTCLQGPVMHGLRLGKTKHAFQAGSWMPDGFNIETKLGGKCTTGVGKRTAEAILQHYKIAAVPTSLNPSCELSLKPTWTSRNTTEDGKPVADKTDGKVASSTSEISENGKRPHSSIAAGTHVTPQAPRQVQPSSPVSDPVSILASEAAAEVRARRKASDQMSSLLVCMLGAAKADDPGMYGALMHCSSTEPSLSGTDPSSGTMVVPQRPIKKVKVTNNAKGVGTSVVPQRPAKNDLSV